MSTWVHAFEGLIVAGMAMGRPAGAGYVCAPPRGRKYTSTCARAPAFKMELILVCTAAMAAMSVSAAPAVDGRGGAVDDSDSDGYPLAAIKRPINMHAQRSSSGLFDMENNDDGWQ
eukprot:COSAG02_NODE_231_length_27944_cov_5.843347_19_plen_116_part_00